MIIEIKDEYIKLHTRQKGVFIDILFNNVIYIERHISKFMSKNLRLQFFV